MTVPLLLIFAFAPLLLVAGLFIRSSSSEYEARQQQLLMATSILGSFSGMILWFVCNSQNVDAWFLLVSLSRPESDGPFLVIGWAVSNQVNLLLIGFYLVLGLLAFQIHPEKQNCISFGVILCIVVIPQIILGIGILHVGIAWLVLFLGLLMNSMKTKTSNFDFLVLFTEIFFAINLLALATICSADAIPRVSTVEFQLQAAKYIQVVNEGLPGYFEGLALTLIFVVCSRMGTMPFMNLRRSVFGETEPEKNSSYTNTLFDWFLRIIGSSGLLFQFEYLFASLQTVTRPAIIPQTGMALGILSVGVLFVMGGIQLSKRRPAMPCVIFAVAALSMVFFFANVSVAKNWSLFFLIAASLLIPLEQFLALKRKPVVSGSRSHELQFAETVYEIPAKQIPNGLSWLAQKVDEFNLDPTLNESQTHICVAIRSQLRWIAASSSHLSVVLMFLSVMIFVFVLVLS